MMDRDATAWSAHRAGRSRARTGQARPHSAGRAEGHPSPCFTGLRLAALALLSLVLHAPFSFGELHGEQDAARLVNDAIISWQTGVRTAALSEYRYYTSPAYIWLIERLLPLARAHGVAVVLYLNWLATVVAVVIVVPAFLLFRRLAGETAATLGTAYLCLVPSFWLIGLYGFPTLPAMLCLLLALLSFDDWLAAPGDASARSPWLVATTMLLTAMVALKADVYLGTVALWGLLLHRRRLTWRNAALLCAVGALPLLVVAGLSAGMQQASPGTAEYLVRWRATFEPPEGYVWTTEHLKQLVKSMGLLSLPLFAVACAYLAARRRVALAAMLCAWAAIPVLFWFFQYGDSARHHALAAPAVALGVGILLAAVRAPAWGRLAALVLVAAVNYLATAPSAETRTTSGNLAASARLVRARVARVEAYAHALSRRPEPRRAFVGTLNTPYVENAALAGADTVLSVRPDTSLGFRATRIEYVRAGRRNVLASVYVPGRQARAAAAAYRGAGYAVFALEHAHWLTPPGG